ncbi:restriction endonuclease subunit S [Bacillus sp. BRMEA1]|uniref:restriction endonuclease subunit S n=1 Tax=Neobacillus endophyticus TaxID=2738405 RepID=UPI0015672737|nr:restriction endonuclease subunit S [Neobacillus endophyticus]NRD76596.1 restriction endonuclease subunit S [Neobacillus endophyticus]
MTKFKSYPKYKESGLQWIKDIPEHWEVKKLKIFSNVQASNVDKKTVEDEIPVLLCNYVDVYYNDKIIKEIDFMKATAKEEQIRKFTLQKNDVLITKDSESPTDIAVPAWVEEDLEGVLCGYHLSHIRPKNHEMKGRYLYYSFETSGIKEQFWANANGVTRFGLSKDAINNGLFIVPPLEEQNQIVDFLDKKTSEIDSLIDDKEKFMKLLEVKRQVVITETVTKGLNPDVNFRDSGVEWIGEIPKHWEIKKLNFLGRLQNGISKSSEEFGFGHPFVSYGDVYKNMELPEKVIGLVNSTQSDRNIYSVKAGDIFFTRTSETIEEIGFASTCLTTITDATFAGFLIRFRPSTNKLLPNYSKYYFRSELGRRYFVKEMNLVTRASLSQDLLKNFPVILPPVEEQHQIAYFLDFEMNTITEIITSLKEQINHLKEYRQSLIYEAVTGKIDVRNYKEAVVS